MMNAKAWETRRQKYGTGGRSIPYVGRPKHGQSKTPTYKSWDSAKQRCTNQKDDHWPDYGGRGIRMCERWLNSFKSFYEDMGERPKGTTIDRIDTNGHYEPSNCRWASSVEQANNRRTNKLIEHEGKRLTISGWSRELRISKSALWRRLSIHGWSIARALEQPVRSSR